MARTSAGLGLRRLGRRRRSRLRQQSQRLPQRPGSRRPSIGDLSPVARRALQATLAVGSSKKRVEPMQIEGDLTLPSPRS